ncbi:MAG TPA: hypothetical protein VGK90_00865 [Rhizomicrobium sp.]|jgi:hypothetical protein
MWSAERTTIRDGWVEKLVLLRNGDVATFADVIAAWAEDAEFRGYFLRELAALPYPAFFWEMPPITRNTITRNYECVAICSDSLARMHPDEDSFAEKFRPGDSIVTFRNLGGDALLVAPCPIADPISYVQIASFLRRAPESQQHDLFIALARTMRQELDRTAARIWVSTSGLGVAWLHIRLDSFPKYYQYRPYAEER